MITVACAVVVGGGAGAAAGRLGRRLLVAARRGVRPPRWACEAGVAVLWAVVAARVALRELPPWWAPVPLVLGWLAVHLALCDLLAARLPDVLTLPAYPVAAATLGLVACLSGTPSVLVGAVLGGALHWGGYALIRSLSPRAMGPGDVKLAGSLGAFAGSVSVSAVLCAMLAAAVLTLAMALPRRRSVPHGPAMLAPVWLMTTFPWAGPVHGG